MIIDKVSLSKTIPTGAYANIKIGIEATLEPGEPYGDALDQLNNLINVWSEKANPHLYEGEKHPHPFSHPDRFDRMTDLKTPMEATFVNGTIPVISLDKEKLEIQIDNATSLEELSKLKEEAGRHGLVTHYMKGVNRLMMPDVDGPY